MLIYFILTEAGVNCKFFGRLTTLKFGESDKVDNKCVDLEK